MVFALLESDRRAWALLGDALGWLIALSIGGSWYLAVTLQEGWGIWQAIFQQDIVNKVSGTGGGGEPWYSYLAYLAGDFLPFWLVLFRPRQLWHKIRGAAELKLLACAVLVPLLVFSGFGDKHAKYLLPTYPVIAVILAYHWWTLLGARQGWPRRLMHWSPLALLSCFVVFYGVFERQVFAYRVEALPAVRQATAAHPELPLYSLGEPDMRLVFYAGRAVQALSAQQIEARMGQHALLFVTRPLPASLAPLAGCAQEHFKPYLKHRKEAQLIQLGGQCQGES